MKSKSNGLNKESFLKKDFRFSDRKRSRAFEAVMRNESIARIVDSRSKESALYEAIKGRAQSSKSSKLKVKEVEKALGEVSGRFTHDELRTLGKELIGKRVDPKIIRRHSIENLDGSRKLEGKSDMPKINKGASGKNIQKRSFQKHLNAKENMHGGAGSDLRRPSSSRAFGHISGYLKNFNNGADIGGTKSLIAKIQETEKWETSDEDKAFMKRAV